ncbi:MAG TPA: 50S ribosomal protein L13 [Terriglobia bacterium]|nr:50S ribosomal protein L13 [Terriglobia bacterium]
MGTYLQKARRGGVRWTLIDAEGAVLGRLAARASLMLTGKNSPDFTPHADHREGVIVINAEKVRLTGKKWDDKFYRHHTGYPGGLKEVSARRVLEMHPERIVHDAIVGMLPKSRLGDRIATRLKVYVGSAHPHAAQRPATLAPGR